MNTMGTEGKGRFPFPEEAEYHQVGRVGRDVSQILQDNSGKGKV
jgi:hypothetical protein